MFCRQIAEYSVRTYKCTSVETIMMIEVQKRELYARDNLVGMHAVFVRTRNFLAAIPGYLLPTHGSYV